MKKEEVLRLEFVNDCHNPEDGRFCSSGEALVSVKGNMNLSDIKKNYPERVGHLNRIVELIDKVHGVPEGFQNASIEIWSNLGSASGAYVPGEGLIKLDAYSPEFNASTLLHEYGHHLTLSERGQSKTDFEGEVQQDIELRNWRDAVEQTPQYKELKRQDRDEGSERASYLRDTRELWARSYSQYISTKTGDKTLLDQHKKMYEQTDGIYQWTNSEFEPIGRAMDAWFAKKGWLK